MHRPPEASLRFAVAFAAILAAGSPAVADLKPREIALIVARGNPESLGLARYYCRRRGVPEKHICEVDLPSGEVLDREQWRWAVRPEIQKWMDENDPDAELRCLVTTWGVPLKIGPAKRDAAAEQYFGFLVGERANRVERVEQITDRLNELSSAAAAGGEFAARAESAAESGGKESNLQAARNALEAALQAAQARIRAMPVAQRPQATGRLQQLATTAGGARVLLQGLSQQLQRAEAAGSPQPQAKEQFDLLRGRVSAFDQLKLRLDRQPPGYGRDTVALVALQESGGLLASLEWLDQQIATAQKNETGASFDSELSLVMWQDGYELLRWQPNYLRPEYDGSQLRETFRTLMVARLDAPTLKLAKGLIDTAIAVEEQGGLHGKVYLDARGLAKRDGSYSPGSYPDYDQSLLRAADGLRALKTPEGETRFDVTLDEQPALFQPGQCPDAAIYCGWYSLAKYVDAFDWKPGAIAYHMASAEATTLKEIDSQAWCKRLLEDGVCVTVGPVYEPYLLAFPRPDEFLAQLVLTQEPIVELYARTKPFNSWMMVLLGDPLYRPFESN
ncbi:MAG: TIGR03790 family protein [Planctomycetota bacterium]